MEINDIDLKEIFPPWFWMVGLGLVAGCAVLLALYYIKYPERNFFDDFARTIPRDLSGLDAPAPEAHPPAAEG